MSWSVSGTYFENCSCEVACLCNVSPLALPASDDRCRAFVCFNIAEGDDLDLSGRRTAIFLDSAAQMIEGGRSFGEPTRLADVAIPFNTTLTLSVGKQGSKVSLLGHDVDLSGKSGASAPFAWAS